MTEPAQISARGYTRWSGKLIDRSLAWWPVFRSGVELAFRKKRFKAFFAFSFLPAFFFLGGVYISERLEDFRTFLRGGDSFLTVNPSYFKSYFTSGPLLLMLIIIMAFSGAGLIADDLKNNALQLYFARPLRKKDYLIGKIAVLSFFIGLLTLLPGMTILIFKLIFSGSFKFLAEYPWLPLSIFVESLFLIVFFSIYTLFLSATSRNSRYVMTLIVVGYYFTDVLFGILFAIFRKPYLGLVSLKRNLDQIASVIFLQNPAYKFPPIFSFAVLGVFLAIGFIILVRRIRSVEVIK